MIRNKITGLLNSFAKKLIGFPALRFLCVAILNGIYSTRFTKVIFERYVFNPYYFPSIETDTIKKQADTIRERFGDLNQKTMLELGPGGDCLIACFLLAFGAKKVFLIDTENHIFPSQDDIKRYRSIYPGSIGGNGQLNPDRIEILSYGENGHVPLADSSVDFIYSGAVFEHVATPSRLIKETFRILKNGGKIHHQIDYRDHIFQQSSLFFLLVPRTLFDLLFSNTGMWTNRIRHSGWKRLFSKYHFATIQEWKTEEPIGSFKKEHVRNLLKRFPIGDLATTGSAFLLEKSE